MMKKANYGGGEYCNYPPYSCYFHPDEIVVGVCALCLKERLLELASHNLININHLPTTNKDSSFGTGGRRRKHSFSTLLALPSFLRADNNTITRHQITRPASSDHGSIASLEDSFISIKFEDNGEASYSWESKKKEEEPPKSKGSRRAVAEEKRLVQVDQQVKPTRGPPLRWRKRIGQLLQLSRWKNKSSKAAGHVGLGGKVELGRRGWMRGLAATRRRN